MDERLDELRSQLDHKTTEIESVVAAEQGKGRTWTLPIMSDCNRTWNPRSYRPALPKA
jgi:hypothetical protein